MKSWAILKLILLVSLSIICFNGRIFAEVKTITYTIEAPYDDSISKPTSHEPLIWVGAGDGVNGFFRWKVFIPKNATIKSAHLKLKASVSSSGIANSFIKLLNYDNCPNFYPNPWGLNATGSVNWVIPAITGDTVYTSPDITPLIKSYIERTGYNYGQYLGLRLVGDSPISKRFYSYDKAPSASARPKLEITYTDGDAVMELWMAEPHVRTKQYIYIQLWNQNAGDRLYVTLNGKNVTGYPYTIQQSDVLENASTKKEFKVLMDYTGLTAGTHTVSVQLKTSADTPKGNAITKTWTTLHSGYPKVGINENNAICLRNKTGDGCDLFFLIAPYIHNKEWFPSYSSTGFHPINTSINTLHLVGYYTSQNVLTWKNYLDLAQGVTVSETGKHWMVVGPGRGEFGKLDDGYSMGKFATNNSNCSNPSSAADCSYVNYTKNHPALLGWTWADEPDMYAQHRTFDVDDPNCKGACVQRRILEKTHQQDTNHPMFGANLYGYHFYKEDPSTPPSSGAAAHYSFLTNDAFFGKRTVLYDVMGHDYYPYEYASAGVQSTLEKYAKSIDNLILWNYDLHPFVPFIETQDVHDYDARTHDIRCGWKKPAEQYTPDPTGPQLKNLIWLSLTHGAKGIFYFNLFCPLRDYQLAVLREFKRDMTELTNVILKPPSNKAIYQTTTYLDVTVTLPWATASVTGGGRVDYTVREHDGRIWVIAARVASKAEGWPNPS
ncbi:hypothetical protein FJZ33_08235, partial [Candidatus Poribacteria bacterium]|nr:hypothetical protein [Candidatus Poribacteria bacterium]